MSSSSWTQVSETPPPPDTLVVLSDALRGWLGCRTWVDEGDESGWVYTNVQEPRICWTGRDWEFAPDYDDLCEPPPSDLIGG